MRGTPHALGILVAVALTAAPALADGPASAAAAASALAVGTQDLRLVLNAAPSGGSALAGQGRLEAALPADGKLSLGVPYVASDGGAAALGAAEIGADYAVSGETRTAPAVTAGVHLQLPTAPGAGLVPRVQASLRKRLPGLPVLQDVRLEASILGGNTVERQFRAALATTLQLGPETLGHAAVAFQEASTGGETHLELGVEHRISNDSSVSLMVTRGPSDPDYDLRTQLRWRVSF